MNIKHALAAAALLWLWGSPSLGPQSAAQEVAPRKQSLTIPITTAAASGKPATSVECVVTVGPIAPIGALAFHPEGKLLAVGGYQEVLLWDLAAAKLAKRIGVGQLGDVVHAVAFTKDGKLLAVGDGVPGGSGAVKIFNIETGELAASFEQPKDAVYSLAISPDGKFLAAGGADPTVYIFDAANLQPQPNEKAVVATLTGHRGRISGVSFSADGKFLSTASEDGSARVWDVETWKTTATMILLDAAHGAVFSSDGQTLAVAVGGPADRAIRLHRISDRRVTRTITTAAAMPLDLVWVATGNKIFAPASDHTVKAYNGSNGALEKTFRGHTDWVYAVALNADATKLASGSADGTVKLWNTADATLLATLLQLSPHSDEWLIVAPQGYLATSSAGAIQFKTTNVTTPPEKLIELFQNAELLSKAIAGEKVAPLTLE